MLRSEPAHQTPSGTPAESRNGGLEEDRKGNRDRVETQESWGQAGRRAGVTGAGRPREGPRRRTAAPQPLQSRPSLQSASQPGPQVQSQQDGATCCGEWAAQLTPVGGLRIGGGGNSHPRNHRLLSSPITPLRWPVCCPAPYWLTPPAPCLLSSSRPRGHSVLGGLPTTASSAPGLPPSQASPSPRERPRSSRLSIPLG